MDKQELIQDTGLFVGQKLFEFSMAESFEAIANLFQTIKQYREYSNPDEAAWFDYIFEIFHLFGFNTNRVAQRLITLQEMGSNNKPRALVCIISPSEDFQKIVFGLDWESYLFYAAKFHQVEWVILTNGLQFKVLNFGQDADQQKYFKCELDEIIKTGKTDSFFTLYKIFSVINGMSHSKTRNPDNDAKNTNNLNLVADEKNALTIEFWTQLLAKSKSKTQLFSKRPPSASYYLGTGSGKKGISYNYVITKQGARIDLYIDNGDVNWNKSVFDSLDSEKKGIEKDFGDSLIWERIDDKRASAIRYYFVGAGLLNKEKWPELQDKMIDTMIRFEDAFRPYIQKMS